MLLFYALLAALVIAIAAILERRIGPAAAGWAAALPLGFAVTVLAVSADGGSAVGSHVALTAAAQTSAQVIYGVAFAHLLLRCALPLALLGGVGSYAACSLLIYVLPAPVALLGSVGALVLGPRLLPSPGPRPPSRGGILTVVVSCIVAALVVATTVTITRMAGTELAGAIAAFPTMCTVVTLGTVLANGRAAGIAALTGLVRSLPCYLIFSVTVAASGSHLGGASVALGLVTATLTAIITWRGIPMVREPVTAP